LCESNEPSVMIGSSFSITSQRLSFIALSIVTTVSFCPLVISWPFVYYTYQVFLRTQGRLCSISMDKVLVIVGDATETVDTLYPYYRLQEDGFEPVVAGPQKRRYHMVR